MGNEGRHGPEFVSVFSSCVRAGETNELLVSVSEGGPTVIFMAIPKCDYIQHSLVGLVLYFPYILCHPCTLK